MQCILEECAQDSRVFSLSNISFCIGPNTWEYYEIVALIEGLVNCFHYLRDLNCWKVNKWKQLTKKNCYVLWLRGEFIEHFFLSLCRNSNSDIIDISILFFHETVYYPNYALSLKLIVKSFFFFFLKFLISLNSYY